MQSLGVHRWSTYRLTGSHSTQLGQGALLRTATSSAARQPHTMLPTPPAGVVKGQSTTVPCWFVAGRPASPALHCQGRQGSHPPTPSAPPPHLVAAPRRRGLHRQGSPYSLLRAAPEPPNAARPAPHPPSRACVAHLREGAPQLVGGPVGGDTVLEGRDDAQAADVLRGSGAGGRKRGGGREETRGRHCLVGWLFWSVLCLWMGRAAGVGGQ